MKSPEGLHVSDMNLYLCIYATHTTRNVCYDIPHVVYNISSRILHACCDHYNG